MGNRQGYPHSLKDLRMPDIPYKNLYIYYLKGHLKPGDEIFASDFIGNWEEDDFSFLFFSRPSDRGIKELLNIQPHLTLLDNFEMTYEQWHGKAIDSFRAGRFFIIPPWQISSETNSLSNDPSDDELRIILDPGVVFGTGMHTTTHDCLGALELLYDEEKPGSVLDLGTGTGLLALSAARLGSANVLAVDFNFLSARTTHKNILLNRLEDRILAVQGLAEDFIDIPVDLVIANIHYDVMKKLIISEGFLRKKWFILSGLLRSEARELADKLSERKRIKILKKWEHDGIWHTFWGKIIL